MQVRTFDKYVNLHFYTTPVITTSFGPAFSQATKAVKSIITPDVGRKPTIRVLGKWVTKLDIQQMEIRVTNLLVDEPLSNFGSIVKPGYVTLEAGYRGGLDTSIAGQIINSYQETPGPDGITVFVMQLGRYDDWISATLARNYSAGALLPSVLQDVCSALGVNLRYSDNLDKGLTLPHPINHSGLAKDLLYRLAQAFIHYDSEGNFDGLRLMPIGNDLFAFPGDRGTGQIYQLDYVSFAKHNAAGFDIQAPWIPSVRPMDTVKVDPRYFRQDIGGSISTPGNLFVVYSVQFEFCTDDDTNQMTLTTVGAA